MNGKRGPRPLTSAAREAILKAAEAEFAAAGFGGARADAIAARAAVNKALPFYYFGSKSALYDEVMRRAMGRLGEMAALVMNAAPFMKPKDRLTAFVDKLFALATGDANWLLLIVRYLIDQPDRARELSRQFLAPLMAVARVNVDRDIKAGRTADIDPLQVVASVISEVLAYFLLAPVLEGMGLQDPLSSENIALRRRTVVELLTRALRGPLSEP